MITHLENIISPGKEDELKVTIQCDWKKRHRLDQWSTMHHGTYSLIFLEITSTEKENKTTEKK